MHAKQSVILPGYLGFKGVGAGQCIGQWPEPGNIAPVQINAAGSARGHKNALIHLPVVLQFQVYGAAGLQNLPAYFQPG
jgi:hypothetical protein